MTADNFSALHRIPQDEVWHHYAGDPVALLVAPAGTAPCIEILGTQQSVNGLPQIAVPGGAWQGARLLATLSAAVRARAGLPACDAGEGFALMGTHVAPAWEDADLTLATSAYPAAPDEATKALFAAYRNI